MDDNAELYVAGIRGMRLKRIKSAVFAALLTLELIGSVHAKDGSHELIPLLFKFALPKSSSATVQDWSVGARTSDGINWKTEGVVWKDNIGSRVGTTVVSINGVPLQVLRQYMEPAAWDITLKGGHAGVYEVQVSSPTSRELRPIDFAALLKRSRAAYKMVACDDLGHVMSGTHVYEVLVPGKKRAWLRHEWSCGSGGCGLDAFLYFDRPTSAQLGPGVGYSDHCPVNP